MSARNTSYVTTSAIASQANDTGFWTGSGAITGLQCQSSTGNVTGTMSIYGLRKAL